MSDTDEDPKVVQTSLTHKKTSDFLSTAIKNQWQTCKLVE
jgi:hypothetical protein